MTFSWYSCISPCVILLYANHRLKNIMNGPNLVETKQICPRDINFNWDLFASSQSFDDM